MNSITGGNKKIRRAVENVWRRRRRKVRGAPARRRKWVAAANKNSARRRRALPWEHAFFNALENLNPFTNRHEIVNN
jgi:hypothetical protein